MFVVVGTDATSLYMVLLPVDHVFIFKFLAHLEVTTSIHHIRMHAIFFNFLLTIWEPLLKLSLEKQWNV